MNCIIIDDDLMSRRVIEEFVERTDQLILVNSYETAVDAINAFNTGEDIDLIFLDIEMPEMNGYETCRRLKENKESKEIPVIFLSGLHSTEEKLDAFEAGGVDYITKPFSVKEVVARVKAALRRTTALEQEINGVEGML